MPRNKENWNLIEFKCLHCGKIIKAFPSGKRKYCSLCAKLRKIEYKCKLCGNKFYNHKSRKSKYCCYEHAMKDRVGRKRSKEATKKMKETKWKKEVKFDSTGRKRAIYLYPKVKSCELCGSDRRICRHHINFDPRDTRKDNIVFLCTFCHNRLHHGNEELRKKYEDKILRRLKDR